MGGETVNVQNVVMERIHGLFGFPNT